MRSKKSSRSKATKSSLPKLHPSFWPLVGLTLILWVAYRALFHFSVFFDEAIGKAIFFGLPVWLYLSTTHSKEMFDTFDSDKLPKGLLLGIAIGGLFGFAGSVASILVSGATRVYVAPLFELPAFWWEFFLALLTSFWESLFFFTFVMSGVMISGRKWPLATQVVVTALIFTLFHIPNAILRFSAPNLIVSQAALLFVFAVGQALLFSRWRNLFAVIVSHALWGMVLLAHVGFGG